MRKISLFTAIVLLFSAALLGYLTAGSQPEMVEAETTQLPIVGFSNAEYTVAEHQGPAYINIRVSASPYAGKDVVVNYLTIPGTAQEGPGGDYISSSGTLTFTSVSQNTQSFNVIINNDTLANEPDETVNLILQLQTPETATLGRTVALLVIADDEDSAANLPVVLKPENTPTPTATATLAPTATQPPSRTPVPTSTDGPPPTPPNTVTPWPSPTPGIGPSLLANGSFEEGWENLPPEPGNLINQEPHGWELDRLDIGAEIWDLRTIHPDDPTVGIVSGIPEMLHKLNHQLPPNEQLGGPDALILEGEAVYKLFHRGAAFGSQLSQRVTLPAGTYRLTVPIQLHWHEKLDPNDPTWDTYTAEAGVWAIINGAPSGGWVTARDLGDRRWFYHIVQFTLPAETEVEVLIRVKSIYRSPKDFFIDAVWLEEKN